MNPIVIMLAPLLPLLCWLVDAIVIHHHVKRAQTGHISSRHRSFRLGRTHDERTRAAMLTQSIVYGFLKMVLTIDVLFALQQAEDCFQYACVRTWFTTHAVLGGYLEMAG